MATSEEWARLQYLEERQAKRGDLTDEEDVEMMELLVAVGAQERYFDSEAGEERYRPVESWVRQYDRI